MKMSELSAATGVPIATIKFYIREGLVPAGLRTSRTTAVYDDSHVDRIRLARALTEFGHLPLARAKEVLDLIDSPPQSHEDLILKSHDTLISTLVLGSTPPADCEDDETLDVSRTRAWARSRGWAVPEADDLVLCHMQRAWDAC